MQFFSVCLLFLSTLSVLPILPAMLQTDLSLYSILRISVIFFHYLLFPSLFF